MNTEEPTGADSDESLLARMAGGDVDAFAVFYDRHCSLLYSIAWRIVGNEKDAEDVLQEASLLIWERAPAYDRALGKPVSWAVTVTRNKAIDRIRATQRKSQIISEVLDQADQVPSEMGEIPGESFGADLAEKIRQALRVLGADQRTAIELAFFGGLSQSEIAEQLGEPLGTIKARIRRGMLTLRDALDGAL